MQRPPAMKAEKRRARLEKKVKFREANGPFPRKPRRDHDKYGSQRIADSKIAALLDTPQEKGV